MMEFRTQGMNGYAVKYSPFFDSKIAVGAAANFGLVGNGRVYVLNLTPRGILAQQTYVDLDLEVLAIWLMELVGIHKMRSTTSLGQRKMKINSLLRLVMGL
jgi:peroxin-7